MVVHKGVTLQMDIILGKPGAPDEFEHLDKLKAILKGIVQEGVETNSLVPFEKIDTAHYTRWVLMGVGETGQKKGEKLQLMYSASVDGNENDHLRQLIEYGREALDKLYVHCEGYPDPAGLTDEQRLHYLKRHKISSTFYTGIVGISLDRARKESELYTRIQGYLDKANSQGDLEGLNGTAVRSKIQDYVKSQSDLSWALKRNPFSLGAWLQIYGKLVRLVGMLAFMVLSALTRLLGLFLFDLPPTLDTITLVGTIGLGVTLLYVILIVVLVRLDELRSTDKIAPVSDEWIARMQRRETLVVQNQWSAGQILRPRTIRKVYQYSFLWLVTQISPIVFIPTVHAARWMQINKNKELAFFTNFDGTSDGYFHTFIDRLDIAKGINMVFASAIGFPVAKWLREEGAITNRSSYLRIIRVAQDITDVWYCAIKHLSVENIKNNKFVRRDLFGKLSEEDTLKWLRRF